MPVRDEERSITRLLDSVAAQSLTPDRVILVDAGSTDSTAALLRGAAATNPNIRVIEAGPANPGEARNIGIREAETDWVCLTDAGTVLDTKWLERLVRMAELEVNVDVVFGSFAPARGRFFERCADLAYVQPLSSGQAGPVRSESIASVLLRRSIWEKVGGFRHSRSTEDGVFIRHLYEVGARIVVAPEARVTWELQPTLLGTFRRFRTFSRNTAGAREQRSWHYGVARQYGFASAVLLASVRRRRLAALVPLAMAARTTVVISRRREGRSVWFLFRPLQFVTVCAILITVDVAMFSGWIEARRDRHR